MKPREVQVPWVRRLRTVALALFAVVLVSSCSLKKLAINMVADALSGGGGGAASTFTSDNDPVLVGDALPFALKLYEMLLTQSPDKPALYLTTGSAFVMYANAYVQGPADMLPADQYQQKQKERARAKNLYLRGRDYVMDGLELRYPGLKEALAKGTADKILAKMGESDVPYLYWAGAGWMAAIGIDTFDVKLSLTRNQALQLLQRADAIDGSYGDGAIHELFISYYGGMISVDPDAEKKARAEYQKAIEISGGKSPGPYVALATSVDIKTHDIKEFKDMLGKALAISPDADPANRLETIITQQKAQWYLDHIDDFFVGS